SAVPRARLPRRGDALPPLSGFAHPAARRGRRRPDRGGAVVVRGRRERRTPGTRAAGSEDLDRDRRALGLLASRRGGLLVDLAEDRLALVMDDLDREPGRLEGGAGLGLGLPEDVRDRDHLRAEGGDDV